MSYIPLPLAKQASAAELSRYVAIELKKVQRSISRIEAVLMQLQAQYAEVDKARDGMVAWFKPAGPQTKDGLYFRDNDLWARLLAAGSMLHANSILWDVHTTDDLVGQEGLSAWFKPSGPQTKDGLYIFESGAWRRFDDEVWDA